MAAMGFFYASCVQSPKNLSTYDCTGSALF
jgi:hypothetical protein